MVDVGQKAETHSIARARGNIRMQAATLRLIQEGTAKKGDVLGVARLAAIQAAKRTADLIPLAHPLALTRVGAEFEPDTADCGITLTVTVETLGRTGVEMEALTAVSVGCSRFTTCARQWTVACASKACCCWKNKAASRGIT